MIAAPSRALIIRRLLRVINHMVKKLEREMALASTKVGTPEAAVLGRLVTALGKLIDLEAAESRKASESQNRELLDIRDKLVRRIDELKRI